MNGVENVAAFDLLVKYRLLAGHVRFEFPTELFEVVRDFKCVARTTFVA